MSMEGVSLSCPVCILEILLYCALLESSKPKLPTPSILVPCHQLPPGWGEDLNALLLVIA